LSFHQNIVNNLIDYPIDNILARPYPSSVQQCQKRSWFKHPITKQGSAALLSGAALILFSRFLRSIEASLLLTTVT
jgi:hypothetical protein